MVAIRKKTVRKQTYYYLEHSFRENGRVEKKEKYLGRTLPKNIEGLKQQFISEIYREKWFNIFDKIKENYSAQEKSTPPSAKENEIDNFAIKLKKDIAGNIRQHQVTIAGSKFIPPFPAEIYPLLMDSFKWYLKSKEKMHPV